MILEVKAGVTLKIMSYVIGGVSEFLLGKNNAVRHRIVEFCLKEAENIRRFSAILKAVLEDGQIISGGQTQPEIDVEIVNLWVWREPWRYRQYIFIWMI